MDMTTLQEYAEVVKGAGSFKGTSATAVVVMEATE